MVIRHFINLIPNFQAFTMDSPEPKSRLGEGGIDDSMVDLLNRKIGLVSYNTNKIKLTELLLSNSKL